MGERLRACVIGVRGWIEREGETQKQLARVVATPRIICCVHANVHVDGPAHWGLVT